MSLQICPGKISSAILNPQTNMDIKHNSSKVVIANIKYRFILDAISKKNATLLV
jgi:hypothetical protein